MVDEKIPEEPSAPKPPEEQIIPSEPIKETLVEETITKETLVESVPEAQIPPQAQPVAQANQTVNPAGVTKPEIKEAVKKKTLSIVIHDTGVLRAAYMQFIKGGGLFIPTKKAFTMGEDTNLVIRLLDDEDPHRVSGKVVWITPSGTQTTKASGIGVEFADDQNGERLRSRIEVILGAHLKSQESTHTM
jgi:type IV pilus assembly protein PilZ